MRELASPVVLFASLIFCSGFFLIFIALWGRKYPFNIARSIFRIKEIENIRLRLLLGSFFAMALVAVSRWPVGLVLGGVIGFMLPTLLSAKSKRMAAIAKSEAIASWAEQLRDVISAAAGLQQAIVSTGKVAPKEIQSEIRSMISSLEYQTLPEALVELAHELDDPAADQVCIVLNLVAEKRGSQLASLLSDLAESCRAEALMRLRVETARAQHYSDAKMVSYVVAGVMLIMLLFNHEYVAPFSSLTGQAVLGIVAIIWAIALYGLGELSKIRRPTRVLAVAGPIYEDGD